MVKWQSWPGSPPRLAASGGVAGALLPKEAGIARHGEPEEIAALMAFLVSPGALWMTGAALHMDGGEVKAG